MSNAILSFTIESEIADMITEEADSKRMSVSHFLRNIIWEKYKDKYNEIKHDNETQINLINNLR